MSAELSLFEKSGLVLRPNEAVVKSGRCSGKVPAETKKVMELGIASAQFKDKLQFQDANGDLVLTNNRLVVIGEKGRFRKEAFPAMDLELSRLAAVSMTKPLVGKAKLLITINLGTPKPEKTEFEVDDLAGWVAAIRAQLDRKSSPPAVQYCMNYGNNLPAGAKFCSKCSTAQIQDEAC